MATLKRKTNNGYEPLPAMVVRKTNAENGNGIGTCSTSSGTALEVVLSDYNLVQNGIVAVTFANDVPANATLNINGKGAKPIIYKGSAIEADVIKADDTVMFCYDGTNYAVTSLGGGGTAPVNPYETVNISLTQVGGNSADLTGASITITDDNSGDTLYTATWAGTEVTTEIPMGTYYTVSVETVTGYLTCPDQSYLAENDSERNISFQYRSNGVYVEATDGYLYSSSNWSESGKTANSVVVISSACSFRVALTQSSKSVHSSNPSPLDNYMTAKSQANALVDYDGEGNTNKIVNFNADYGTNSTEYAAPYCKAYTFTYPIGQKGYLPSMGQLTIIMNNKTAINACMTACYGTSIDTGIYWSSTFWGIESGSNSRGLWTRKGNTIDWWALRENNKVCICSDYE